MFLHYYTPCLTVHLVLEAFGTPGQEPQNKTTKKPTISWKRPGKIKGAAKASVNNLLLWSSFSLVLSLEQLLHPDVYRGENTLSFFIFLGQNEASHPSKGHRAFLPTRGAAPLPGSLWLGDEKGPTCSRRGTDTALTSSHTPPNITVAFFSYRSPSGPQQYPCTDPYASSLFPLFFFFHTFLSPLPPVPSLCPYKPNPVFIAQVHKVL